MSANPPLNPPVALDSILRTDELNRRPARPRDYETENRALVVLARALAERPQTVLQALADTILDVFKSGSAGVSLLTKDERHFYWPAIAGQWTNYVGGGTPRDFGPCGDVLDRDVPLLMARVERRYTYFEPVTPAVEECLLVPFYVDGKAVGTIWAVAHDEQRKFDNEDLRQMLSLSRFASAAYEAHASLTTLRESETRYRRLFEAARDGILILDATTGKVVDVNGFLLDLLRLPREHFIGKELWELGVFPDKERGDDAMRELQRGGGGAGSVRYENLPLQDGDGRRIPVDFAANVYQEGSAPIIQCNLRDISERTGFADEREAHLQNEQLLRADAEAANRAKDLFLATLSHEMRTPLNAIVGWMSILRGKGCTEIDLKEGLDVIERNTTAQVQLIEDVLDVSRIISGKLRLEIRPSDLAQAVSAGVEVMRAAAAARDITLDVRLDADAADASCDPARIQQVVWNLVSNAVKFTPRGGRVGVRLSREKSGLRIEVSDSGHGINPELLPFVFDRFRQADSGTRRKFGGLGLGLSIVKHIVELHGGTVEAHSAGDGKGSTFTIRLPVRAVRLDESEHDEDDDGPYDHDAAAPLNRAGPGEVPSGVATPLIRLDGLRVLVVDDEADARRLLVKVLEEAGATVAAAPSAPDALEALASFRPEVLVSDLGMPDQDGFDLIRAVRHSGHHPRDLPAVALTAFVQKDDQRKALLAGFQVHVSKPVDPHDLTTVIASLTGRTG